MAAISETTGGPYRGGGGVAGRGEETRRRTEVRDRWEEWKERWRGTAGGPPTRQRKQSAAWPKSKASAANQILPRRGPDGTAGGNKSSRCDLSCWQTRPRRCRAHAKDATLEDTGYAFGVIQAAIPPELEPSARNEHKAELQG